MVILGCTGNYGNILGYTGNYGNIEVYWRLREVVYVYINIHIYQTEIDSSLKKTIQGFDIPLTVSKLSRTICLVLVFDIHYSKLSWQNFGR